MKKKICLLILFLVLVFIISFFIVYNIFFKIKIDNTNIKYISDLEVEVYSEVFVSDLIEIRNGKIIEDWLVNTTKLGDKEIQFLYEDEDGRKKYGLFSIKIVDSIDPKIFLNSSYTLTKGSDKVLTDVLMSVDNYDSKPRREIIGNYDINKVGEYNLTYKVTDSSGNSASFDFVLKVVEENQSNRNDVDESYTDFKDVVKKYKSSNASIGIDVSKWQGDIDFKRLKEVGAEFVMIRVGSQDGMNGESVIDPYFEKNIEGAIENGLKVGIYYYSHAKTIEEAREQALWVIDKISKYDVDLPVVFDWENWSNFNLYEVSLYDLNQLADTFMNTIEKNDYQSMLYGSKYYLENIWNVDYKNIWLAHYIDKTDYKGDYTMWQLSSTGKIDGIESYVDIDVMYNN